MALLLRLLRFALQNLPELEIFSPEPFDFGNPLRTSAKVHNYGGIISDLRVGIVLLGGVPMENEIDNIGMVKHLATGFRYPRLGRNRGKVRYFGMTDEQRNWLEPMLNDQSNTLVYAYIRADYMSTANPIQGPVEYSDSASFWWNTRFKKFMEMSDAGHKQVEKVVALKGVLAQMNEYNVNLSE